MKKKQYSNSVAIENDSEIGDYGSGAPTWKSRELTAGYSEAGQKGPGIDAPFLIITLLILAFGLVMLLSASYARQAYASEDPMWLFSRQLFFAITGLGIMFAISGIRIKTIGRWSIVLLLVSLGLLVFVLFSGVKVNGAMRWLGIGGEDGFTFQPSEIAKLAIIMSFAQMMCRFGRDRMKTFKFGVFPFVTVTFIMIILLYLQPHLSAVIIITVLAAIMMFAGGTRFRWFLAAGLLFAALIGIMMVMSIRTVEITDVPAEAGLSAGSRMDAGQEGHAQSGDSTQTSQIEWDFSRFGYAGSRINAWIDPEEDPLQDGFQIRQSLNAVGSGGLLGQGLGQSRQKHLYLPEEHNDFIFAVVSEELGFIGSLLILFLFALLIIRGYWLALNAKDRFSSLVTIGITSLLAIQVFLNIAVVTNLLPATGISLPFFSYGGTALWIQMAQIGIVLAVSREIPTVAEREFKEQMEEADGEMLIAEK